MTNKSDRLGVDPETAKLESDSQLLTLVKAGDQAAYAKLYERHAGAALAVTRRWARNLTEAEDLVAEAFTNVLAAIQAGGGPTSMFRAYLYSTIRNSVFQASRTERHYLDIDEWDETLIPADDFKPQLGPEETAFVRTAFGALPPEDREILWYTEVENLNVVKSSVLLGLTKSRAYAALRTAKEHLREEYLRVHLSTAGGRSSECQAVSQVLPRYIRGTARAATKREVSAHIEHCVYCAAAVAELRNVNRGIHGVIAPIILGAGVLSALGWGGARPAQAVGGIAGRILATSRLGIRPVLLVGFGIAAVIALGVVTTHAILPDAPYASEAARVDSGNTSSPTSTNPAPGEGSETDPDSTSSSGPTAPGADGSNGDGGKTEDPSTENPTETIDADKAIAFLDLEASTLHNGSGTAVIRFHNPTGRALTGVAVTVTLDPKATLVPPGSQQAGNAQYSGVSNNSVSTTVGTLAPHSNGQLRIAFNTAAAEPSVSVSIKSSAAEIDTQKTVAVLPAS